MEADPSLRASGRASPVLATPTSLDADAREAEWPAVYTGPEYDPGDAIAQALLAEQHRDVTWQA